jgi:cell wall-associated NlpC family hydrolase
MPARRTRRRSTAWILSAGLAGSAAAGLAAALLALLIGSLTPGDECGPGAAGGQVVLGAPENGQRVGATEYGGPGDSGSGTVGASGIDLAEHPDSYAELGGVSFATATALGGLPYLTPLRITWGAHSAIAYKRDFGLGGGPVDGFPRVIDLWWQFAQALGIPYEDGLWSGPVSVSRPPAAGAANLLGQSAASPAPAASVPLCGPDPPTGVPLTSGQRARLLSDGLAAAPATAPAAVREMIAAGNQIVGKPYLYGGGHGLPLSEVAPAYDCSSSVEHLLYGGRLVPVNFEAPSSWLESFGDPGPGSWVTLYASPDHVFMYVAGLRWDTHDAEGPGDGSGGIGWHPLIRSASGFIARHPVGL